MLKIDDKDLEKHIAEILKKIGLKEPRDYIALRVTSDLKALKQNKKLPI